MRTRFQLNQRVWHVLGGEHSAGMVTGILFRHGAVLYYVTWSDRDEKSHYETELSDEQPREWQSN